MLVGAALDAQRGGAPGVGYGLLLVDALGEGTPIVLSAGSSVEAGALHVHTWENSSGTRGMVRERRSAGRAW